jgi:multiple sugar transport system ATP-binding protein
LDATLRLQTRADIVALQRKLGTTMIYVTHDQVEAMTMGHRIAVMNNGELQQIGNPVDLYNRPANAFVAHFLGTPGMNLVSGVRDGSAIRVGTYSVGLAPADAPATVTVGVRAEDAVLASDGIAARVLVVEDLGSELQVVCDTPTQERIIVKAPASMVRPAIGDEVFVQVPAEKVHFFDPITGLRLS